MANDEDLARLRQGVAVWNDWRMQNYERPVDLSGAILAWEDLRSADLGEANLETADLRLARLVGTDLAKANLMEARIFGADLSAAILTEANLCREDLTEANLRRADLAGANLYGACLSAASLIDTNLTDADLTGCRVYGISAWNLKLDGFDASQHGAVHHRRPDRSELYPVRISNSAFKHLRPRSDEPPIRQERVRVFPDLRRRFHWVLATHRYDTQEHLIAELN